MASKKKMGRKGKILTASTPKEISTKGGYKYAILYKPMKVVTSRFFTRKEAEDALKRSELSPEELKDFVIVPLKRLKSIHES
jgi:hypothetical protein